MENLDIKPNNQPVALARKNPERNRFPVQN